MTNPPLEKEVEAFREKFNHIVVDGVKMPLDMREDLTGKGNFAVREGFMAPLD